jgi:hypothetical protein
LITPICTYVCVCVCNAKTYDINIQGASGEVVNI